MTDLTATLIIWPPANTRSGAEPGGQLTLLEHFRPVWTLDPDRGRRALRAVALPTQGLATALVLHLAATGREQLIEPLPRPPAPVCLDAGAEHRLFGLFRDTAATLLRFDGCCISDDELRVARQSGFIIELVDLSGQRHRTEGRSR